MQPGSSHQVLFAPTVDGILVTRSSSEALGSEIYELKQNFSIKDMGRLSYFLGIKCSTSVQN
ncbi:hypothetical protein EJ110_NYTH24577 [Nymphaea thermarum]|nr:hypothetical protein EJ110_NYTH24577 [Nymphaea thermarum]